MRLHVPHLHPSVIPRRQAEGPPWHESIPRTGPLTVSQISAEAEAESKGRAGAGLSPPPIPVSFRGSARNLGLARSHPSSPSHSLDVPQMLQVRLWRAPRRESRDENSGLDNITGMLNLARFLELCNRVSKAEGRGVRACLPSSGHADYSTPHPTPFLLIYAHHPASIGGNHGPAYRHAHRRPGR